MRQWCTWRYIATGCCCWIAATQLGTHVLRPSEGTPCALQPSGFNAQLSDAVCAAWLEPEVSRCPRHISLHYPTLPCASHPPLPRVD
jgi:hypothetical protein